MTTRTLDGASGETTVRIVRFAPDEADVCTLVPALWHANPSKTDENALDDDDAPSGFIGTSARRVLDHAPSFASDSYYAFVIPAALLERIRFAEGLPVPDPARCAAQVWVNGERFRCQVFVPPECPSAEEPQAGAGILQAEPLVSEAAAGTLDNLASFEPDQTTESSEAHLSLEAASSDAAEGLRRTTDLVLLPLDDDDEIVKPFTWSFGAAAVAIDLRLGFDQYVNPSRCAHRIDLRPILVMQREGEAARRFLAMAERVARGFSTWFAPAAPRGAVSSAEPGRTPDKEIAPSRAGVREFSSTLEALGAVLAFYEAAAPRLRSAPRMRHGAGELLGSAEQMRSFTAATAAHIATHPDEWVETMLDTGLRLGSRSFLPKRTLVDADAGERDIPENHAVLGFLMTVAAAAKDVLDAHHNADPNDASQSIARTEKDEPFSGHSRLPGYVSGAALLEAFAALSSPNRTGAPGEQERARQAFLQKERLLKRFALRAQALLRVLVPAFPFRTKALDRLPAPTHLFTAAPLYRELWLLMRAWFKGVGDGKVLDELHAASHAAGEERSRKEDFILEALDTPRLYERLAVTVVLEGLAASGLRLASVERIAWPTHDVTCANKWTFVEEADGDETRSPARAVLWYEPAVFAPGDVERHGVGLVRTTSWRLKPEGLQPGTPKPCQMLPAHYAPDMVLMVEKAGERHWLIADAKLRRPMKTVETEVMRALLKYGVTTRPADPSDRMEAVRLLCAIPSEGFQGMNLNDLMPGLGPNVEVEVVLPDAEATTLTDRALEILAA